MTSIAIESLQKKFPQLRVLRQTASLRWLHTQMRDQETSPTEYVRCSDILINSLLEDAISTLPFRSKPVTTPTGHVFDGVELAEKVVGVSVLRAGESMESGLRQCIRDASIGKILIQRDESTEDKRPKLFYCKLPRDIHQGQVLLLDPMVATGGSACSAIQCLLDADVPQEKITFVNIVSCPEGIHRIFETYPSVKMITSMVDERLNDDKYILPGLGDFGDRYFGT